MSLPIADNPTLTPEQAKGLEQILARTAQLVCKANGWTRNCLACVHFHEGPDICGCGGWNQRPAARIIVTGCPQFQDKDPF